VSVSATGEIDPRDPFWHGRSLWVVYGPISFPTFICAKLYAYTPSFTRVPVGQPGAVVCLWGYSVYRGQPGFRTFGQGIEKLEEPHFFADHDDALAYLKNLTTPRIGSNRTSAPINAHKGPMGDGEPPVPDTAPDEGASVSSPPSAPHSPCGCVKVLEKRAADYRYLAKRKLEEETADMSAAMDESEELELFGTITERCANELRATTVPASNTTAWMRGFATGLAEVSRLTRDYKASHRAMRAANLTVEQLRAAGVAPFDSDEIAKGFGAKP
jgi:hypothetical protein